MSVLLYLVPAALGLGLIGLFGFMWSMRSGQYDDLEGAANRILSDDDLGADAAPLHKTSLSAAPLASDTKRH